MLSSAARTIKPAIKLMDFIAKLATPLVPDDYIELVNPLWVHGTQRAVVEEVRTETADAASITLRPARQWQGHQAGQFVQIAVAVNGVRHQRSYSISSAPERADGRISITVKAVDEGRVSNFLVHALRVGSVIEVSEARGDFLWPNDTEKPLLLIAAGSGITPIISQLRSAAARNAMPKATLLYYSPRPDDSIFRTELLAIAAAHPALSLRFVHTRAGDQQALSGHFAKTHLDAACPDWLSRHTLACGPAAMLDAVEALWVQSGKSAQLSTERFAAKLAPLAGCNRGGTLSFLTSGGARSSDGKTSILETAEAAGLAPAHGCRMGICHGCTVQLKSGQVRDLRDGRVFGEEDDLIQICVCAPAGDVAIEL
jgi:ferredoxin-NADP reductase